MKSWKGKTRGGLLGYKIFIFILKNLGLLPAYFVLRFVAAYFIIFSPSSTKHIYHYCREIRKYGKFKSFRSVYKCYYIFGQTLIDKIAITSGMEDEFSFTSEGIEHIEALKDTGGVIISAHLGNWDIASYLLKKIDLKINVLMFEAEHEKIKNYLDKITNTKKVNIIPIRNDLSHIFKVNAALKNKEVICMHGDRFLQGSRTIVKPLMGKNASFPIGPFSIIGKLGVPYTIAFALRGKDRKYHFTATPLFYGSRSSEEVLDKYISELEEKMELNPLQWFNFFDFWEDVSGAHIS